MIDFEAMVSQIVSLGYSRAVAESQVRAQHPAIAPPPADVVRDAAVLERKEQAEVAKIFRAHGCLVYSLSQPRATKQAPGLADLYVFAPRARLAWWFEVKRPVGGVQSPAQREFQQLCDQCGVRYVIGGQREAWALVQNLK